MRNYKEIRGALSVKHHTLAPRIYPEGKAEQHWARPGPLRATPGRPQPPYASPVSGCRQPARVACGPPCTVAAHVEPFGADGRRAT